MDCDFSQYFIAEIVLYNITLWYVCILFYSTLQTLFTVIFFASFHEFMREMNIKVPKWWAKHRRQAEGEVSLTELHDDEGIVSSSTLSLWRFGGTSLVSKSLFIMTCF